ncbi:BTAD domain-containing putative transcriptional regulator [Streptacidiphilus monticola]
MRYRVLGPVAMLPRTPTAAKLRVLLATLLVRAGQVVPSETLVDELWGDRPPRTVTTTLQVYVSQLRTLLAEGRPVPGARDDLLQTRPPGYRLQVGPGELDLTVFEEQVRDGRQAYDAGRHEEAAERLHEGLAQWRGAALSGVPHGPVLSAAAVHLEEARLAALDLRIAADLRCGRHVQLTAELVALAAEHPYRESLHAHLMVALYRSERQTDALAAYRRLRDALVDELGVEPGPGLSRLHERILRSDPALDWRPSSAGGRAPQLWLPAGPAELLGRERATTAALRMLSGDAENPPARVLGISGRAGIGKTAFALDLARRWAEHLPDGQVLVPLRGPGGEPLNAAAVAAAVLRRLGHEVPQGASPERELTARLRGLRLLLLLDDASAEQQVRPVADALADGLLLLTSRRTLVGLQGARHLVLDVLTAAESLRLLFAEGGTGAAADPAAAREIVRICGRLPLALRVAGATLAARPHWTAADLAERLGAAATRSTCSAPGTWTCAASSPSATGSWRHRSGVPSGCCRSRPSPVSPPGPPGCCCTPAPSRPSARSNSWPTHGWWRSAVRRPATATTTTGCCAPRPRTAARRGARRAAGGGRPPPGRGAAAARPPGERPTAPRSRLRLARAPGTGVPVSSTRAGSSAARRRAGSRRRPTPCCTRPGRPTRPTTGAWPGSWPTRSPLPGGGRPLAGVAGRARPRPRRCRPGRQQPRPRPTARLTRRTGLAAPAHGRGPRPLRHGAGAVRAPRRPVRSDPLPGRSR